jgi:cytochrome oxidase Cu insertion factor (SCO1/SenC/PrrC family)
MIHNKSGMMFVVVCGSIFLALAAGFSQPAEAGGQVGDHATDFTLPNVLGDSTTLSDYFGSPIVLYFWSREEG